MTNLKIERGNL